ncbi:cytochrome c biogenesis protein CcdC [Shimazuella sp. AN120528]|uniref:CcdC family protein n=1 Tax=Shimazuella soli TaxID=1892854 RepID=UPI001F117C34|nr:cytochrome c biogenesis protein CcdC [Shimazuella soli]MCH5583829.1 cytochrome c biogenesis protein CcdC [Shimazuella soli]
METFFTLHLHTIATIVFIVMALSMIMIRIRSASKPTNAKKILIPPLGMSTGFLMFLFPPTHISWTWAGLAFLCGSILFSIPLIKTSKFELREGQVYLKRSPAFVYILVGLLTIRLALHSYIEHFLSIPQTGALFFILAFGMLVPWRIAMYLQYQKLLKDEKIEPLPTS